jgi:hypothetical protein
MTTPTTIISCCILLLVLACTSHAFVQQQPAFRRGGLSSNVFTTKLEVSGSPIDPSVEAELCTTMAHMALDFTGLMSPSKSIIRLFAVIGRLLAISADYLPDHSIHSEEFIIQGFLLALALRELVSERLGIATSKDGRA